MQNEEVVNPGEIVETISHPEANKQNIEAHKSAAAHHIEAAKHHLDAVKHHENGNHDRAAQSTVFACGHHAIAGEYLSDDAKHHSQTLKETKYQ